MIVTNKAISGFLGLTATLLIAVLIAENVVPVRYRPASIDTRTRALVVHMSDEHGWAILEPGQRAEFDLGNSHLWQQPLVSGQGLTHASKMVLVADRFARQSDDMAYNGTIAFPRWWCLSRAAACSFIVYYYVLNTNYANAPVSLPNNPKIIGQ